MEKRITEQDGTKIAIISDQEPIVTDVQSILDLMATIEYYDECFHIALHKSIFDEAFFDLSTGIAGEILQKFVNYHRKVAIIGDFSVYSSKALRDFIYECNNGTHIFFVANETEAIERLTKA